MSPSDVAGIFSRYFVIGFFLPGFFVLVGLSQTVSDAAIPASYENLSGGAQVAVAGGAGILLGLLLLGLNWQILRLFEGYPLQEGFCARRLAWIGRSLVARQRRSFDALVAVRDSDQEVEANRSRAAWMLDVRFPPNAADLMPTRFGNAIRAFETYGKKRWGLDSVVVWPRIDMLLSERGAELEANARGQVCFFVNGSLLLFLAGTVLVVDEIAHSSVSGIGLGLYVTPFLGALLLARWSAGAVGRWGSTVRAAVDLHRLELYERLGIRLPESFSDERERIADQLNQALLYGHPISDEDFAAKKRKPKEQM